MTDEEKKILSYLARRYRQYNYDGASEVNRIANLLDRFVPEDAEQAELRLPVFDMNPRVIDQAERLSHSLARHLAVTAIYKEGTVTEALTLWPLKLFSRYNCDYVGAYSVTERRQRTLRLDCFVSMTVTSEPFDPAELETLEWSNGDTSDGTVKKPFTAKLVLSVPAEHSTWLGYRIRSSPEPNVIIVEFHDSDVFLQQLWIAGTAWKALLAPKWLKEQLERRCRDMLLQLTTIAER